jgi:hypothetical protein
MSACGGVIVHVKHLADTTQGDSIKLKLKLDNKLSYQTNVAGSFNNVKSLEVTDFNFRFS